MSFSLIDDAKRKEINFSKLYLNMASENISITAFSESRSMRWAKYVVYEEKMSNTYNVLVRKP
jgi:hypothetical protein